MRHKLKIDLHTHCFEALGFPEPTEEIVGKIVRAVKEKGLDGIAVTEHNDRDYGFKTKLSVERFFGNEVIIIPGQEIDIEIEDRQKHHRVPIQLIKLYFPENRVFTFLPHPGFPSPEWINIFPYLPRLDGIEIRNGNHSIDRRTVEEVAYKRELLLVSASDAHELERVGIFYNELEIDELLARAGQNRDKEEL